MRAGILLFAVFAGGLLAVVLSLLSTMLLFVTRPDPAFHELDRRAFMPTWIQTAVALAPGLILVAAGAAAVQVLYRRPTRLSSHSIQELSDVLWQASRTPADAPRPQKLQRTERAEPFLKDLNLDIDRPAREDD
jgi:hypothetical protein